MKKINLLSSDMITILAICVKQLNSLKGINKLFNTNVADDLNHEFIYDDVLRYILDNAFVPNKDFPKQTKDLFFGSKNCWIIHNKLCQLLEASSSYWASAGNFKLVLDLSTAKQGYFDCYIYYDKLKELQSKNADFEPHSRDLTTLRINLFNYQKQSMHFDKNFIIMSNTSLNILNKLLTFSHCTGFFKWIDINKKLVEPLDFNEVEKVLDEAKTFINNLKKTSFVSEKDYKLFISSNLENVDHVFSAFNEIEKSILNFIEQNKERVIQQQIQEQEALDNNLAVQINKQKDN